MVSDSLYGFGNNFIAMITGQVGAQFVAAYSITTVTQQMSSVLTQGVAQSSSVVIGHTLGRQRPGEGERRGRCLRRARHHRRLWRRRA